MTDFKRLPKVELHLHLDCSLSYEVVSSLIPGISHGDYFARFTLSEKCEDLADFLSKIPATLNLLQTRQGLREATLGLMGQLREDGVIYAEIRFAPLQHLEAGLSPEQVVECVLEAMNDGIAQTGVEARLILCTLRHFSEKQGLQTARLVKKYEGTRVAGLDLAADEAGFPLNQHRAAFAFAREHGLHRTAHAGEALGAGSVIETLAQLQPSRIGHGVRSVEDDDLVARLAREQVHLEVCPSCNVMLDVVDTIENHPVDQLYRAGVPLSINTDGRSLPKLTLTGEYALLHRVFGWQEQHFLNCNLAALAAAFLSEPERTVLIKRLRSGYPNE